MKIRTIAAWGGTALLAFTLAACSSLRNNIPTPPAPATCVLPSGVQTQLLYPIPGATAVPDAPQQIVFAISSPLPNWGAAVLPSASPGIYGAAFQTITAGQVPTPSATPSFASPIYVSSALPGSLPPNSLIAVFLNNLASNCSPVTAAASFTTQ
ncbi:MAG: hypothetical protein M3R30_04580 [Candidatus Eremiobacteraeota bacterium]|nr:hypothetical protein [Candidatus Eremiobacteraeota bacterium]